MTRRAPAGLLRRALRLIKRRNVLEDGRFLLLLLLLLLRARLSVQPTPRLGGRALSRLLLPRLSERLAQGILEALHSVGAVLRLGL